MKEFYFISGLPRSGSTLLSTILKQNPEFYADIHTPMDLFIDRTLHIIDNSESKNVIDKEHRKNILNGIFDGYYKHVDKPVIFDTSRTWTKKVDLLKCLFPYTKIICTVRDVVSILNSFEVLERKNCLTARDIDDNVFFRCQKYMEEYEGVISKALVSLEQGLSSNPSLIKLIEYEDLCKNPEKVLREIYSFLNKPYYNHSFKNLEYSNKKFDMKTTLDGLHTIKSEVIYNPPKCILPESIVEEYKDMEFWRRNKNKTDFSYS
jgi:sulfotransferase|tara:strand:+ start:1727 stop:2515 length:789 start_codon:yes stop_codon:yes gene_type:complete